MDIIEEYFDGLDPATGALFSNRVRCIGFFEFGRINNAEELKRSILPFSGNGLLFLDVDDGKSGVVSADRATRFHIDATCGTELLRQALEEESLNGVGLQSYTYSTVMIPDNHRWVGWVSHYWDIGAIGFLDVADAKIFNEMLDKIALFSAEQAKEWICQWGSAGARQCFEQYIAQGRLISKDVL